MTNKPSSKKPAKQQASLRSFKNVNHEPIRKEKTYKQTKVPGTNKSIDRQISAKPVGWRRSATGKKYFEDRENRSDTDKERKYHGRATQKPAEREKTKRTTRTTTRGQGTARRTASVRKHDKQKPEKQTVSRTKVATSDRDILILLSKSTIVEADTLPIGRRLDDHDLNSKWMSAAHDDVVFSDRAFLKLLKTATIHKFECFKAMFRGNFHIVKVGEFRTDQKTAYPAGLLRNETLLARNKYETLMAFSSRNSAPFLVLKGDKKHVSWGEHEQTLRNANIITHNHPHGSSFSAKDIHSAECLNVGEMRCFGEEYLYILKRPINAWPSDDLKDIEREMHEIKKSLDIKYTLEFFKACERMSEEKAQRETWQKQSHEIVTIYTARKGLIYTRTKR